MCLQINQSTLVDEIKKTGTKFPAAATSSDLNTTFLGAKKAVKLPGAPKTFEEIPAGKIVVADMTNYTNIHVVAGPSDLSHLKSFQADYYLIDFEAIQGLY